MITRIIYPLSLRESISWQIKKISSRFNFNDRGISLEFNKKLFLDLSKDDTGHQSIILNGYYELQLTRLILKLAAKGGLLVDAGANYGYFTCLWAGADPSNTVIAFEASPANQKPLLNNIAKNNLTSAVTVEDCALGEKNGKLNFKLFNEGKQTGWGGLTIEGEEEEGKTEVEVEVRSLDNYFADRPDLQIDVLKIDVEGADTWVIKGASELIKHKRIKNIFFEVNKNRMKRLKISELEAPAFLAGHGYEVISFGEEDFHAFLP